MAFRFLSSTFGVILFFMLSMGAQALQLEHELDTHEQAAIATLQNVFAMIKSDYDEKRLRLTPTRPAERGFPLEIEGKRSFSRIMDSVKASCRIMGGDHPDSYECEKQFSDTKIGYKIYFYLKTVEDIYLLDSGILHVDKSL